MADLMPMNMTLGASQQWHGTRVTKAVGKSGARGVTKGAEFLKGESVPLAPLNLGPLRESGTVIPAVDTGGATDVFSASGSGAIEAVLVFDTVYAAIQHERLDFQHDDGQAKYVEEPFVEKQNTIQGIIAAEIRAGIQGA